MGGIDFVKLAEEVAPIEARLKGVAVSLMREKDSRWPDGASDEEGDEEGVTYIRRLPSYYASDNKIKDAGDGTEREEDNLPNLLERRPESGVFRVLEDARKRIRLIFMIIEDTSAKDGSIYKGDIITENDGVHPMDTRGEVANALYGDLSPKEYQKLCLHAVCRDRSVLSDLLRDTPKQELEVPAEEGGQETLGERYRENIAMLDRIIARIQNGKVESIGRLVRPDMMLLM
jgi:hypothetical protein